MLNLRALLALIITPVMLCSFEAVSSAKPLSLEPERTIYQIYVRGFYDGSNQPDGEGDLKGLEDKLDYLEDLGVGTLLLMPITKSTGGMGYIPVDYFSLDPAYGSEQDLANFIASAHARNIKVVMDAPVNHISDQSEWFKAARKKECRYNVKANPYCNFFYYVENPCGTYPYYNWHKPWQWDQTNCSAVFFKPWDYNYDRDRPGHYYATFFQSMPDINFYDFNNHYWNMPTVQTIRNYFHKWASLGVDGFRIDAAKHFVEGYDNNYEGAYSKNIELLKFWLDDLRASYPQVSFIAEAWAEYDVIDQYLTQGATDMALDFPMMSSIRGAVGYNNADGLKNRLRSLQFLQGNVKPGQRVIFAGNHDVQRMMTEWNNDTNKVNLAHFVTLNMPFTPLFFYGEEVGMHGRVKRATPHDPEEYVRTVNAFPWDGSSTSGFPGGRTPVVGNSENHATYNLVSATLDPGSVYHRVKTLLALRKNFMGTNSNIELKVIDRFFGHVLGFTLIKRNDHNQVIGCRSIVANFSANNSYDLAMHHGSDVCPTENLQVKYSYATNHKQGPTHTFGPYGMMIID